MIWVRKRSATGASGMWRRGAGIVGAAGLLLAGCQGAAPSVAPGMLETSTVEAAPALIHGVPVRISVAPEDVGTNVEYLGFAIAVNEVLTTVAETISVSFLAYPSPEEIFDDPTALPESVTIKSGEFIASKVVKLRSQGRPKGYVVVVTERGGQLQHVVVPVQAGP